MPPLKPTFTVTAGRLSATTKSPVGGLTRILVERDMDTPADAARLWLNNRSGVALDDAVVVKLGNDGDEATVFTGKVAMLRPALDGVIVEALGSLNALLALRTSKMHTDTTPGDIVSDLASAAGVTTGTIDSGPRLPRFALDSRLSAYAHIKDLADRLGYEVYADRDGKLMFHALGAAASLDGAGGLSGLSVPSAVGGALGALVGAGSDSYAYGQNLLAAYADMQTPTWGKITVGGESPASGQGDKAASWLTAKDTDYDGAAGEGKPERLYLDPAARTQDLAERFAKGRLATAQRRAHQVRFTTLGRATLDLGDNAQTSGASDDQINASGYIRALRHRFGAETGFVTDIRVCVKT